MLSVHVDQFVDPNLSQDEHVTHLNTLLLAVHKEKLSMKELVTNLGKHLPSKDNAIRSRATLLLAEILSRLPTLRLPEATIQHLVLFYCARLQDFHSIGEVVHGMYALTKYHKLSPYVELGADGKEKEQRLEHKMIQSLEMEVIHPGYVQALGQRSRSYVIKLLSLLLQKYPDGVKELKSNYVYTMLRVIDQEKDPRNLLIGFQWFRDTLRLIPDHKRFSQELFEVVSVYFPITFRPRPNDTNGITQRGLKDALRGALGASPSLAPHCFPFLQEQLKSDVSSTLVDALETMCECVEAYGSVACAPHMEGVWKTLYFLITTTRESDVVDAIITTVRGMLLSLSAHIVTVSTGTRSETTAYDELLTPLLSQCIDAMSSPVSRVATACSSLLQAAASVSVDSCRAVLDACVPRLLSQMKDCSSLGEKQALLDILVDFAGVSNAITGARGDGPHPMSPYGDELFAMCEEILANVDGKGHEKLRATSVVGMQILIQIGLMDEEQTERIVRCWTDRVLLDESALVKTRCIGCLVRVFHSRHQEESGDGESSSMATRDGGAQQVSELLLTHTVPRLVDALLVAFNKAPAPEDSKGDASLTGASPSSGGASSVGSGAADGSVAVGEVLGALTRLGARSPRLARVIVPPLLAVVTEHWTDERVATHVLPALRALMEHTPDDGDGGGDGPSSPKGVRGSTKPMMDAQLLHDYAEVVCPTLLRLAVSGAMGRWSGASVDGVVVSSLAGLMGHTTGGLTGDALHRYVASILALYVDGETNVVAKRPVISQEGEGDGSGGDAAMEIPSGPSHTFKPFQEPNHSALLPLLVAVVGSIHPSMSDLPRMDEALSGLRMVIMDSSTTHTIATIASQGIAAILNKFSVSMDVVESSMVDPLVRAIDTRTTEDVVRRHAMTCLSWISKALIMRGDSYGYTILEERILAVLDRLAEHCKAIEGVASGVEEHRLEVKNLSAIADVAAQSIDVILKDCTLVLNKKTNARIRVLYKQRFFSTVLPDLLMKFNVARGASKDYYLLALSGLVRHTKKAVLLPELRVLLGVVVQGLQSGVCEVASAALSTLSMLLEETPNHIAEHLSSVVPALLKLSTLKGNMHVRVDALKALEQLCALEYDRIFPFAGDVVLGLRACVGDHKRAVRRQAVQSRNKWCTLK